MVKTARDLRAYLEAKAREVLRRTKSLRDSYIGAFEKQDGEVVEILRGSEWSLRRRIEKRIAECGTNNVAGYVFGKITDNNIEISYERIDNPEEDNWAEDFSGF